jgi:hypothetical protein
MGLIVAVGDSVKMDELDKLLRHINKKLDADVQREGRLDPRL